MADKDLSVFFTSTPILNKYEIIKISLITFASIPLVIYFFPSTNTTTKWDLLLLLIKSHLLIPTVRSILVITTIALMYLFSRIGISFPILAPLLNKLVRLLIRIKLFIFGYYYIPTIDKRSEDDKNKPIPQIWAVKHVSAADAALIMYSNNVSCMGTIEIFKIPIVGTIVKFLQCVPVHRDSKGGRSMARKAIIERAHSDNLPLAVFVEGTTSQPNKIISFRTGAFEPRMPVNVVNLNFNKNKHWDNYYDGSYFNWFYRCFFQFINYVEIEYHGIYEPDENERIIDNIEDPSPDDKLRVRSFADKTRRYLADKTGYSMVDVSRNDLIEHNKGQRSLLQKIRNLFKFKKN